MTYALWAAQVLLALIFLFTGGTKLFLPFPSLMAQMPIPLPGWFIRGLGAAEVLGAAGMILPGLFRIRPGLTPLAAMGMVIILIGATVYTLLGGGGAMALIPAAVGCLAVFVAYGRARLAPLHPNRPASRPRAA
jgi:hypothetical protein